MNKNIIVMYSKKCKKEIRKRVDESTFNKIHERYMYYLNDWNRDLGGTKNFHNKKGGTYDCIFMMCYYEVCNVSKKEIEEIEGSLFLPSFKRLKFVNISKKFYKKLLHKAFVMSEKKCKKFDDYRMKVYPLEDGKPIHYTFTTCPVNDFAKKYGFNSLMPSFCNPDYKGMEYMNAKLVRTTTCSNGDCCDYVICHKSDKYLADHMEYVDEEGYIRNK